MRFAIIGAGMAGLSAASRLRASGRDVSLFDKGRGPGGRMSTRRMETPIGELRWDHGAQFFTVRDAAFQKVVDAACAAGQADIWDGPFSRQPATPAYVGKPGMNGIIRFLADPLNVTWSRRVTGLRRTEEAWTLDFEDGRTAGPFDVVLSAVPAEQAGALLHTAAPELAQVASNVRSAPCWAALAAFTEPVDLASSRPPENSCLSWVARNCSKPGREDHETWVLHGSPDWSQTHLEAAPAAVSEALVSAFRALGEVPAPVFHTAHRWRYAQVETPTGLGASWDPTLGLGTCGDWHLGPRVEAAWLSGRQLAEACLA